MKSLFGLFYLMFFSFDTHYADHDSIPVHLYECYEKKVTLMPMSMTTLIDIIRKVETSEHFYMDMRMLTNAIINRFWRDGIVRDPNIIYNNPNVIGYKTSGFQSHKYKLLYSYLIPNSGYFLPNEILTLEEKCTLHFMLSSSIDIWERGDEDQTCPDQRSFQKQWENHEWSGVKKSTCPIENGVISTRGYGTVSPNHILGAIASALQPLELNQQFLLQSTKENNTLYETINNVWASTICGDLAEVLIFQMPMVQKAFMGPPSIWNNSELPVHSYIKADYNIIHDECWQFTDAEILGGIDGLILANEIVRYSNITYSLRLSQVLEMFYTNRGGNFPSQTRACTRQNYFFGTLLSKDKLLYDQTSRFAEVLATYAPRYFNDTLFISHQLDRTLAKFKNYASNLVSSWNKPCPVKDQIRTKLHLFVVFDSTWSSYETLEVLMHIANKIDVSHYGSTISVINGVTGDLTVNSAKTTSELYLLWTTAPSYKKITDSTNLERGFIALKLLLESTLYFENKPLGLVTLILTPSTPISDSLYNDIESTVKSVKSFNPDMKFIYVTSTINRRSFTRMTLLPGSQSDHIIKLDDKNKYNLYRELEILQDVPRSLAPTFCTQGDNGFVNMTIEQYITTGTKQKYRIHPVFLCSGRDTIEIKVLSYNYGNLEACMYWKSNNSTCLLSSYNEDLIFTVKSPCTSKNTEVIKEDWNPDCRPVYIEVNPKRSFGKCAEKDCRFPDDLRFSLKLSGLKCLQHPITCNTSSKVVAILIPVFIVILFNNLINDL
ncbi:uncharacterized protein LOC106666565 isoform X2 [Cimex lectularius]|uniref:Nicastrin n=1 Tax=Cimex lectularius TaxID=79782 RepID=A0A8I6RN18_CIMLE|nr:uncharacterized protein LOC106666565 isoform X2 [Cimex lectularius]